MTTDDYAQNIFLNCPFDDEYRPLLNAIIFTVQECGFVARCALESMDASESRVGKIYNLIYSSKLGIHDLSRVQLDKDANLPRFNMPLELGIFLGAKFLGHGEQKKKVCLILDEDKYRYQRYISDISGQDIVSHQNDVPKIITLIRNWLAHETQSSIQSGEQLGARYARFRRELVGMCERDHQNVAELTFRDFRRYVVEFGTNRADNLQCGQRTRWGKTLLDPPLTHIREAISGLRGRADSFVILSKAGTGSCYMQVHGAERDGYTFEYQDGSPREHYRCIDDVSLSSLITAFQQFRSGTDEWRQDFRWKRHQWWSADDG